MAMSLEQQKREFGRRVASAIDGDPKLTNQSVAVALAAEGWQVSAARISDYKAGKYWIRDDSKWKAMAKVLGVTVDYLQLRSNSPKGKASTAPVLPPLDPDSEAAYLEFMRQYEAETPKKKRVPAQVLESLHQLRPDNDRQMTVDTYWTALSALQRLTRKK